MIDTHAPDGYAPLMRTVVAWAHGRDEIRALVLIGSRARGTRPADVWSDVDLILLTADSPERFATGTRWADPLGEIWFERLNRVPGGFPEWILLFTGGLKVDFLFAPLAGSLAETLGARPFAMLVQRGAHILVDKTGSDLAPALAAKAVPTAPAAADIQRGVHSFWLAAYRMACLLRRGDRWRAAAILNGPLRQDLVDMIAWHAQVAGVPAVDTWFNGRFLEEWADARVTAVLAQTFARYDSADLRRALLVMMDLFEWLSVEVGERQQYAYPETAVEALRSWIGAVLAV